MPGSATYASDASVAERARAQLDAISESVGRMERVQRQVIGQLVELWPMSGWKAAGVRSAKAWLHAHTGQSWNEADRLARIARLCARYDTLAAAVVSGRFPLGWADTLGRAVSDERAQFLTDEVVESMVRLADSGVSDEQFGDVIRYWKDLADQHLAPHTVPKHSLVASQKLFGGGEVHADLAPVAFESFMGAIDAMCQDPDPADAPYQRTLAERRADAADDMACFTLTHGGHSDQGCGLSPDDEDELADDVFDGTTPGDATVFDELLDDLYDEGNDHDSDDTHVDEEPDHRGGSDDLNADQATDPDGHHRMDHPDDDHTNGAHTTDPDWHHWTANHPDDDDQHQGMDELDALRQRIRSQVLHRQRRTHRQTRPRSAARVNIHIDLATIANLRGIADLDGLVLRGEGWNLARSAAEQFLCDSTLVATLFRGNRILDANADAEQFSARQRRAIAARDRHCVFPGCRRPPRHCDAHHLHERDDGGPTIVDNGCLLCRFHHRLIHQYEWTLTPTDDGWIATDPHGHDWHERRPTPPAATGARA